MTMNVDMENGKVDWIVAGKKQASINSEILFERDREFVPFL